MPDSLVSMRRLLVASLVLVSARAHADAPPDPCGSSMTKPNVVRPSSLTGDWGGARDTLDDHGITPGGSYAPEIFASPETDDHYVVAGLAVLSLDLALDKLIADGLGSVHIVGLGIHGKGLSEQIKDVYGVSNNVATNEVRLFEAWIEQPITEHGAVRAGLLSADQEFVIARHSTVLMNATFGVIGQISTNEAGQPVYPIARPGVSGHADAGPIGVRVALYDGSPTDEHGIPTTIGHSALALGELEVVKTVKLGAWTNTQLANGVYAVVDRSFPSLGRRAGAFARLGYSPDGVVQLYADAGVRGLPGDWRHDDFAGLGVAFSRTVDEMGVRHDQAVAEATYQIAATGWWTVQPDLQVVFAPDRTALVGAVRMTIVF
jgi:carbohydrate-selective porin OprB